MGLSLAVSAFGLLVISGCLALLSLSTLSTFGPQDTLTILMLAAGTFALGLLLVPGAYLNAQKVFNWTEPGWAWLQVRPRLPTAILLMIWVVSLALGQALAAHRVFSLVFLPVINTFALILPVAIALRLVLKDLPWPSARRAWSIFGASAMLGPGLAIFLELFALLGFVLLLMLYAASTPGLDDVFRTLLEELRSETTAGDFTSQQMTTLLLSPGAVVLVLGLFAVVIPIVEEICKVFLLWFYAGKMRSPVEGFVAGVLCGAAFALAENVGFSSAGAEDWLLNVLTRVTAVLPHIFNSGLVGWGLVLAWQRRDYVRFGLAYLAATLVHGVWNALSVALAFHSIGGLTAGVSPLIETPLPALITWFLLVFGILGGLFLANHQVRKQAVSEGNADVGYNLPSS